MRVYESIYVDGDWTDADAGERIEVLNPATERVIAAVPAAGPVVDRLPADVHQGPVVRPRATHSDRI